MDGRELLMSIDKAIDSAQLNADLTSVANAIRTKGGTSAALTFPAGFVQAINDIHTEPETANIIVYGSAYAQVSYTGPESGTVTLDANGEGAINVTRGTYSFADNVSLETKTVDAGGASAIARLRPESFLYWYGAKTVNFTAQTNGRITFNQNSIDFWRVSATSPTDIVTDTFSRGAASKMKFRIQQSNMRLYYPIGTDLGNYVVSGEGINEFEAAISAESGAAQLNASQASNRHVILHALWLE